MSNLVAKFYYKRNINKKSINNIERPRQWSFLLQYDNKNQTDAERRTIVMNKLEHWSRKNCFLSAGPRSKLKSWQCLKPLHGDNDHKKYVAGYILFFAKFDNGGRSMIIIEKLKILFDVQIGITQSRVSFLLWLVTMDG